MLSRLHHVVLFCRDTDVSKAWYERVGFTYLRGYDGMHWFGLGETEIMLHPAREGSGQAGGPDLHAAVTDVDAFCREVKRKGLQPTDGSKPLEAPVTRPWGHREFQLRDPDGHSWYFTQVER